MATASKPEKAPAAVAAAKLAAARKKRTITEIRDSKHTGEKMAYTSVLDYTSAKWAEAAGVDVCEAVPATIAKVISQQLEIPTIGIGVGVGTDEQILLSYDLLGVFTDFKPKFTQRFANLTEVAVGGLKQDVAEVKAGTFPDDDHSYGVDDKEYEKFLKLVQKRRHV